MDADDLKRRTKQFSLNCIALADALPASKASTRVIANQLLRSSTSVGANYRAACRSRSRAEFVSKLGIVEEECDESAFWLELIAESGMLPKKAVAPVWKECGEIVRIIVSSIRTARDNKSSRSSSIRNPQSAIRNA